MKFVYISIWILVFATVAGALYIVYDEKQNERKCEVIEANEYLYDNYASVKTKQKNKDYLDNLFKKLGYK